MSKQIIDGNGVPRSFLPFSPAVRAGDLLFISGQASVDLDGNIVPGTFEEEFRRTLDNIQLILKAAGLELGDVVQVRNYVGKPEYLQEFNALYKEYFQPPYPARATITGCLGEYLKYEAEVVAYIKK